MERDALSRVHLRVFELGRVLEDPVEEPFVFAKEQRLLRLAGNVEHAEHEYEEDRDGSQNGHGHDPPGAASGTTKTRRGSANEAQNSTGRHGVEINNNCAAGSVAASAYVGDAERGNTGTPFKSARNTDSRRTEFTVI